MIDIKDTDLLNILISLTTIPNESGELMPNYCFASDLTIDLDCSEEDISKFALNNGYKVFKVFPGETMLGGYVIIPKDGTIKPVEKMYKEFYGEIPEISEVKLDENDSMIVLDEAKKKTKSKIMKFPDPNAKAMWGRTRHKVELPKKGKGSFKRHLKHKKSFVEDFRFINKNPFILSLYDENIEVGTAYYSQSGYACNFYIKPNRRNHGLGKLLFDELLRRGVYWFHIEEPNQGAKIFYERYDFIELDLTKNDYCKLYCKRDCIDKFKRLYNRCNGNLSEMIGGRLGDAVEKTINILNNGTYRPHFENGLMTDSYKNYSKHYSALNENLEQEPDLDAINVDELRKSDSDTYKKLFEEDAKKYGATIEWNTDIYPDRQYAFWYGPVCNIHYKGYVFSIFTDEYGEFTYRGTTIRTIEDAEDEGFFTDDDLNNPEVEWNDEDCFYTWIYKEDNPDRGIGMQSDLNWDPVSMLEDALDIDILLTDVFEEAMTEYFNEQDDVVDEELDIEATTDESIIPLNKGQKLYLYDDLIYSADDGRYDFLQNKEIFNKDWVFIRDEEKSFKEFGNLAESTEYPWYLSIHGSEDTDIPYYSDKFIDEIKDVDINYKSINFNLKEESLDKNYLKLLAKKHKKTDKKGAMGWWEGSHPHQPTVKGATLNKNAGNVEANISHFNHVMGNSPVQADGSIGAVGQVSGGAVGESLDLDVSTPYNFSFHSVKEYMTKGFDYDGEEPKEFWYQRVPESAMKVSRDDFVTNKLLRRRKNNAVFKGVKKFFLDHPKAKWCVIEAQDPSRYDKYLNVYRLLMECKVHKNINKSIDTNKISKEKINESIEKHDKLNPVLFDENNKLKPEVKEKLLEIAKEFTNGLKENEIKFKLKDIKIVGSNCSYNYNPDSDIDLHLVMDTKSLKCPDNLYPLLYSSYRSIFNSKINPTIKGIPVEIFVETDDTEDLNNTGNNDSVAKE